jgi:hypothetical protein
VRAVVRAICAATISGSAPAVAGPRAVAAQAVDGERPLAAALEKAGWIATPEGSDRFRPGNVYDARNALWSAQADCFDAAPVDAIYNDLEVTVALEAGAKVPLGVVSVRAEGSSYKKLTYADPRVAELAGRQLTPTPSCQRDLEEAARSGDVSSWYVVQSVLYAIVHEQLCTEVDASVRSAVASASASYEQQCTTSSTGQVAVAYKTVPVTALIGPIEPTGAGWTTPEGCPWQRPVTSVVTTLSTVQVGDAVFDVTGKRGRDAFTEALTRCDADDAVVWFDKWRGKRRAANTTGATFVPFFWFGWSFAIAAGKNRDRMIEAMLDVPQGSSTTP